MKPCFTIFIALAFAIACSNDKAAEEKPAAETKQSPEPISNTTSNEPSGDGIAGFWKLTLEAYDNNENKVLDEEERKKGIKNRYSFRFNADGSCTIQELFKGRYEVKTEAGKEMLYVYRNRVVGEEEKDPPPDIYRIISMSKSELVLLEPMNDLVFWVFERVR